MQRSAHLCPVIALSLKHFLLKSDLAHKAYGYLTDKEQYNFFQMSPAGGRGEQHCPSHDTPPYLSVSHPLSPAPRIP